MKKKLLILAVLTITGVTSFLIFNHFDKIKYSLQRRFAQPNRVAGVNSEFDYRIVFLGDSMTESLGNFVELEQYLQKYYKGKRFLLLNYGFGSTNVISAIDRIEKESSRSGRAYQAINDIPFDLILVESFGHNPLSQFPLQEGLKKQIEVLDKIVDLLTQKHPKSSIVFVATIAPNKDYYALDTLNLLPWQKEQWVAEREEYIKNHIKYAKSKNIPVIDIYQQSLKNGTGNLDYISTKDFIHPSPTGIYFISQQIADFIGKNKLLEF